MRQGIVGIGFDRLLEIIDRCFHLWPTFVGIATLIKAEGTFYVKLVSDRGCWVSTIQSGLLCRIKAKLQSCGNLLCDLVLNREDVSRGHVKTVCPKRCAVANPQEIKTHT